MKIGKRAAAAGFVSAVLTLVSTAETSWAMDQGPGGLKPGTAGAGVAGSREATASAAEGTRPKVIDRAPGQGGIQAGPVAEVKKEFSVRGSEIVDSRRGLVFNRCAHGQQWGGSTCTGTAGALVKADIFNPQAKANLGDWRVPSVDELGAAMAYFSGRADSPFKAGTRYWSSTRATLGRGYYLMQYGPKKGLGNAKPPTMVSNSDDAESAALILVRSGS